MEIWEPKPPGILWATPGLLRDPFTFIFPEQRRSQPARCHHNIFNAKVAIGAEATGKIERC
jgi:hypothetical protein